MVSGMLKTRVAVSGGVPSSGRRVREGGAVGDIAEIAARHLFLAGSAASAVDVTGKPKCDLSHS
jgi:hypothetical protein